MRGVFDIQQGYCCCNIEDIVKQMPREEGYSTQIPISYVAHRRVFFLEDCPAYKHKNTQWREGDTRVCWKINYCLWCGAKFPDDLSEVWRITLLQDYGIDPKNYEQVPVNFKTDHWWRERGL